MSETATIIVFFVSLMLWAYAGDAHRKIAAIESRIEKLSAATKSGKAISEEEQSRTRAFFKEREAREIAQKVADERTARNREVKRRAKARKAGARLGRLVGAVNESLVYERGLRDEVARERGWPIHPNDMDLDSEAHTAMMEAWRDGEPPKPEWLNSSS